MLLLGPFFMVLLSGETENRDREILLAEERRAEIAKTALLVDDIKVLERLEPNLYPYQVTFVFVGSNIY